MANELIQFTTPVGRLVGGSVSVPQDKDADGKPLIIKTGKNTGQPTVKYYVALAIPKAPGQQHWAQRPAGLPANVPYWGEQIWAVGHKAFPNVAASHQFAWKVEDGDSEIPNKKGTKPCNREGFAGNWILHCGSTWPIQAVEYEKTGKAPIDPKTIKRGYYVEIAISCQGNGSGQNPGIYLNPQCINLRAFGPEIVVGFDADNAGFGQGGALPPGASTTPPASSFASAPPPAGAAPVPAPGAPYTPPPMAGLAPPAAAPAVPNPAILAPPPASPAAPPAPPAAPAQDPRGVPTAKAAGASLDQMLTWPGWTLDLLKANGYVA